MIHSSKESFNSISAARQSIPRLSLQASRRPCALSFGLLLTNCVEPGSFMTYVILRTDPAHSIDKLVLPMTDENTENMRHFNIPRCDDYIRIKFLQSSLLSNFRCRYGRLPICNLHALVGNQKKTTTRAETESGCKSPRQWKTPYMPDW